MLATAAAVRDLDVGSMLTLAHACRVLGRNDQAVGLGKQAVAHAAATGTSDSAPSRFALGMLNEFKEAAGPFGPAPAPVPGKIEAEDFDRGGEGVAYHDTTWPSTGTNEMRYRTGTSVDFDECGDQGGGRNVGGIMVGEWLAYTVEVADDGLYDIDLRVAAPAGGAKLHIEIDGHDLTGPIEIPNTGGHQRYQTTTRANLRLAKGRQVMRICFDQPNHQARYLCNLNWIAIRKSVVPRAAPP
jgi:hypothetical protein